MDKKLYDLRQDRSSNRTKKDKGIYSDWFMYMKARGRAVDGEKVFCHVDKLPPIHVEYAVLWITVWVIDTVQFDHFLTNLAVVLYDKSVSKTQNKTCDLHSKELTAVLSFPEIHWRSFQRHQSCHEGKAP